MSYMLGPCSVSETRGLTLSLFFGWSQTMPGEITHLTPVHRPPQHLQLMPWPLRL